jgi:hypothetical protein
MNFAGGKTRTREDAYAGIPAMGVPLARSALRGERCAGTASSGLEQKGWREKKAGDAPGDLHVRVLLISIPPPGNGATAKRFSVSIGGGKLYHSSAAR